MLFNVTIYYIYRSFKRESELWQHYSLSSNRLERVVKGQRNALWHALDMEDRNENISSLSSLTPSNSNNDNIQGIYNDSSVSLLDEVHIYTYHSFVI